MNSHFAKSIFFVALIGIACRTAPPEPQFTQPKYVQSIHLYRDDIGLTEAWLKLHFTDSLKPKSVIVYRDTQAVFAASVVSVDTLLYDTALQVNTLYTYHAYQLKNGKKVDSSEVVAIQTLNTTSHNFNWYMDTLGGGHSSSDLSDVAIVSDSSVWAVGNLSLADTVASYNAAHWDGTKWTPFQMYVSFCPSSDTVPDFNLTLTYSFDNAHQWLSDGLSIVELTNGSISRMCIPQSQLSGVPMKVWGLNLQSVYLVGTAGTLAYYNGSIWTRVPSGTSTDINDIWGDTTLGAMNSQIIAVVTFRYQVGGDREVLRIKSPQTVDAIPWSPQASIHSVWFKGRSKLFLVGDGIFLGRNGAWQEQNVSPYYSARVRGTGVNNVVVVGAFGSCSHFDGLTWKYYPQFYLPSGSLEGLDIRGKFVVAVGYNGNRAVILRGYQE